jgi:hypothetical protein
MTRRVKMRERSSVRPAAFTIGLNARGVGADGLCAAYMAASYE